MSEAFILGLAEGAMRHPALATSVHIDVLVAALTTSARLQFGGEEVQVYVPKVGSRRDIDRRAREIRALWTGQNAAALGARYGLSERQIRRIVGVRGTSSP